MNVEVGKSGFSFPWSYAGCLHPPPKGASDLSLHLVVIPAERLASVETSIQQSFIVLGGMSWLIITYIYQNPSNTIARPAPPSKSTSLVADPKSSRF